MFPVAAFKRAFDEVLEREKGGAFSYMDIMGHNAVCQLLVERRGGFAFIQFHMKNVLHRFPLYFFFL